VGLDEGDLRIKSRYPNIAPASAAGAWFKEGTSTVASNTGVGAELSTLGRAGLISDRLSEFASSLLIASAFVKRGGILYLF
jgi:hypothetical protein